MKILPTVKLETLKSLSFFKQISDAEIIQMQQLMETRYYHKDEIVISEQEPGDLFFILLEGSVNINKKLDGGELEILTTLEKPGDFFGEMSLLEDKPRSASVVAAKDCTILIIRKEHFLILVKSNPELTMHIAASVANFLRDTDLKLITTLIKKNHEIESAYQKLKEAQEELLRKERLSLVGKLSSSILHDLRNPMTTIAGYAQLLREQDYSKDKVAKLAEIIQNEVENFIAITQELFTFSIGETGIKPRMINLQGYLIDVIDFIEPKFRRHGIFVEHSLDYSGDVFIDPNRFRRAIENICNNALDAMREGGTFQIETKVDDNRVKIAFIDQGCGMNDYVREHIFEEFFTFGKAHGTGLGLSIAKRIIEEHKGSIQVKSELGKGTTFIIDLPLS